MFSGRSKGNIGKVKAPLMIIAVSHTQKSKHQLKVASPLVCSSARVTKESKLLYQGHRQWSEGRNLLGDVRNFKRGQCQKKGYHLGRCTIPLSQCFC